MAFPLAQMGYYLEISDDWERQAEDGPRAIECTSPEEACQVTVTIPGRPSIPSGATNWHELSTEKRPPFHASEPFEPPGCRRGYARKACAVCSTDSGDKHYRRDSICLPCPATGFTFWQLLAAALFVFLIVIVASTYLGDIFATTEIANQLVTPLIILVGFLQTLSVVIQMNLRWPSILLDLFSWFSIFSFK
jgi:hypothetical protein|eukprot:COSAG06_NODE_4500_length_4201_cov_2.081911_3_plen_192_part_00